MLAVGGHVFLDSLSACIVMDQSDGQAIEKSLALLPDLLSYAAVMFQHVMFQHVMGGAKTGPPEPGPRHVRAIRSQRESLSRQ